MPQANHLGFRQNPVREPDAAVTVKKADWYTVRIPFGHTVRWAANHPLFLKSKQLDAMGKLSTKMGTPTGKGQHKPRSTPTRCWSSRYFTQAANDKQQLAPMLDALGELPEEVGVVTQLRADAGYFPESADWSLVTMAWNIRRMAVLSG